MKSIGTQFALVLLLSAPLATNAPSIARSADLPDALAAGWKGQATCELLDEYEQVRILRCTFPPASVMNDTLMPEAISGTS
jgi:hypothetical protein